MKKQKVSEFIKGKSFYFVLLTGLCAVIVIALVYTNMSSTNKNGLVDLNEPAPNVVSNDKSNAVNNSTASNNNQVMDTAKNNGKTNNMQNNSLLENDIVDAKNVAPNSASTKNAANVKKNVVDTDTIPAVETKADSVKLNFHEEDGLSWPISGNVLLNFNMEHGIYFETLGEYKVNPAIIIQGKIGEKVASATKGIVTDIVEDEETGLTITMAIGSGYNLIYGQLNDVKVKVGDTVTEGETLGYIAKPTKYYIVEGSNLYFQVIKDDEAINPMLLLKDSE